MLAGNIFKISHHRKIGTLRIWEQNPMLACLTWLKSSNLTVNSSLSVTAVLGNKECTFCKLSSVKPPSVIFPEQFHTTLLVPWILKSRSYSRAAEHLQARRLMRSNTCSAWKAGLKKSLSVSWRIDLKFKKLNEMLMPSSSTKVWVLI